MNVDRLSFGFHNPNHAAALVCALLPLCFGLRRAAWVGRGLAALLFAVLLLTQSRTGLMVAALEWTAWWAMRRGRCGFQISDLRSWRLKVGSGRWLVARLGKLVVVAVAVGLSLWWLGSRLALDGSILNRPRIWLAGLRLFAANPDGVGLGNSGALASAFMLDGIPEIRTMVNVHITLLAELGWIVGWAWFSFIGVALCGFRTSPRVGLAFAGLVVSGCASTVFDWPVLFDFAAQGGLGAANRILSWLTFALFVAFCVRLIIMSAFVGLPAAFNFSAAGRPVLFAGALVLAAWCVPAGDAPRVRDGYAASGTAPRALALYDDSWSLRAVRARVGTDALVPVRPVTRFPRDLDFSFVRHVLLFGDCREWVYLVPKGIPVTCSED